MMKAVIGDTIFTGTLLVGCSFLYFSTKDTCTQSAFVFVQIVKASLNNQVKVKNKCTVKLPDLLKSNCVTDEKGSLISLYLRLTPHDSYKLQYSNIAISRPC